MKYIEVTDGTVERIDSQRLSDLSFDNTSNVDEKTKQALDHLRFVARSQPETMYKTVMQLQSLIADTNDDPKLQGKAYLNLARCFIGIAANKVDLDPEGAKICLFGTPQGRMALDHNGKVRGYDGALDAVREASRRLPRDSNLVIVQEMANILKRRLQR